MPLISSVELKDEVLHPLYVTGFSDGESTFTVSIVRSKSYSTGWAVHLSFAIGLNQKDIALLYLIKSFFL